MNPPQVSQTLHGYVSGHRLLAASPGVTRNELEILDMKSDLPGYVPHNHVWSRILFGYPLHNRYAFACMRPDPNAGRGGAVLTHTLLLPFALLSRPVQDLELLFRDAVRGDWAPFQKELVVDWTPKPVHLPLPRPAVSIALAAGTRPLICEFPDVPVAHLEAEEEVFAVWETLPPERRASFSFCTNAFHLVSVHGSAFDMLCIRPASRGAFHRFRGTPNWVSLPLRW